jgi:lipid II:glycine glycyltransferase (peptidoglycan interpeptide bridge formation enzyme)
MKSQFFSNQFKPSQAWDDFVLANALDGGLLQSGAWGKFQTSLKRAVWQLGVKQGEQWLIAGQAIRQSGPAGLSYWYLPRSPVLAKDLAPEQQKEALDLFFAETIKLAKKEKAILLRFEPTSDFKISQPVRQIGDIQPRQTLVLDLTKPAAELLAQMKSKTRYNISVAQKHQVQIEVKEEIQEKDFAEFWRLQEQTAQRQKIKLHPRQYYWQMLQILSQTGQAKLYLAKWQNRVIAANVLVYAGDWAYYLHGASSDEDKNLMAPYLLHWQAITEAQAADKKFYDFWGVSDSKESWQGITRFKQGFAPGQNFVNYFGCFELPVDDFWYRLYRLLKK